MAKSSLSTQGGNDVDRFSSTGNPAGLFHSLVPDDGEKRSVRGSPTEETAPSAPRTRREAERALFELARYFTHHAQAGGSSSDRMTANVLLALREARRSPNEEALRALEKGAHKLVQGEWNKGFATTTRARTTAKEHLLQVIADAIACWLPLAGGGTRKVHAWSRPRSLRDLIAEEDGPLRVHPGAMPPPGFHQAPPESKMAIHIDHFGLRRHRWDGVLPPLPKDRVQVIRRVLEREILHGRLRGPHNARTVCMKLLAEFGMTKAERDRFIGFMKMRTKRDDR